MKIRITIIFVFLCFLGKSQDNNIFNYNYPLAWQYDSHAMVNLNNNYYICGNVARQEMPCIYWLMGFHVSKINSDGIFDTIRYFDKCEQGTYTGFMSQTMCSNGDSICIIGNISTDSLAIAFILMLNEDLDTLTNHIIFSDTLTRRMHAITTKDNSFITCGGVDSSYNSINNPTPALTYSKALISEIGHNGELKWTKDYRFDTNGGNCWSVFHDLCITPDNGIIVLGVTYDLGSPRRNLIMKTDSIGNQLWVRFYGNTGYENHIFTDIIPTHDSCFIVCGAYTYGETFGGLYPYDGWLIKIDNNGNQKWNKKYRDYVVENTDWRDTIYNVFNGIVELEDGRFAAISTSKNGTAYGRKPKLYVFNEEGDSIFTKLYETLNPWYNPTTIQIANDNGYAIAGYGDFYDWDEEHNVWVSSQRIFLIKTDSLGNDTLISDISPVQSKPITEFKLECYPNPASSEFFVDLPQGVDDDVLEIYSTNGSLVHEQRAQNGINTVNNCNLQPGVYLLRLRDKKIFGKIIIE